MQGFTLILKPCLWHSPGGQTDCRGKQGLPAPLGTENNCEKIQRDFFVNNDQLQKKLIFFFFKHNFGELISHPFTELIHLCEVPGREEEVLASRKNVIKCDKT